VNLSAMAALDAQWEALKCNTRVFENTVGTPDTSQLCTIFSPSLPDGTGISHDTTMALQRLTLSSLRDAQPYAWSANATSAVTQAARSLASDTALSSAVVPEVISSGWWYFSEHIPTPTLLQDGSLQERPVSALLWKRQISNDGEWSLWFSTFMREDGNDFPSIAWNWADGTSLRQCMDLFNTFMGRSQPSTVIKATLDAALWFSTFFVAGSAWLRQRIIIANAGNVPRQCRRRIQREHKLDAKPQGVLVVELRRTEPNPSTDTSVEPSSEGEGRAYTHRWIVSGHWRNQWYPSQGSHAPKWIESYLKGPDDKPIKEAVRVFAVRR
jgi:hypothetical protein